MRTAILLTAMAACAPATTPPPETPPPVFDGEQRSRFWFGRDGGLMIAPDPFDRADVRRADHEIFVTRMAPGVALIVRPQMEAPAEASNLLASALVRRFDGRLPDDVALSEQRLFIATPYLDADGAAATGTLVVDWVLTDAAGASVGAVWAERRLSGVMRDGRPLTALTADDAEHIALQSAAQMLETDAVRAAVARAAVGAAIDAVPPPAPRPFDDVEVARAPAPAPRPRR